MGRIGKSLSCVQRRACRGRERDGKRKKRDMHREDENDIKKRSKSELHSHNRNWVLGVFRTSSHKNPPKVAKRRMR